MSSIFGLDAFSCGDNVLTIETVLAVRREIVADIGKEDEVSGSLSPKEEEEELEGINDNGNMGGKGLVPTPKETKERIAYSVAERAVVRAMETSDIKALYVVELMPSGESAARGEGTEDDIYVPDRLLICHTASTTDEILQREMQEAEERGDQVERCVRSAMDIDVRRMTDMSAAFEDEFKTDVHDGMDPVTAIMTQARRQAEMKSENIWDRLKLAIDASGSRKEEMERSMLEGSA